MAEEVPVCVTVVGSLGFLWYWYDKFAVFVSVLPTGAVFTRALYETSTSLAVPGCNAFVKFNPDAKSPV